MVVSPQVGRSQPRTGDSPLLHAESALVLVPTIVTDKDYRPIFDLQDSQFELRVDHAVTPLSGFWKETGPLSVVLVLDASGSMRPVLRRSMDALQGFLNLANPADEYALVLCKEQSRVEVPFTSDLEAISRGFLSVTAKGSTPLFDAIEMALELIRHGKHERRAILVISDGEDTNSLINFKTVRSDVLETRAYFYVLQFWTGRGHDILGFEPLRELTELTGATFFQDVSPKRFAEYFGKLDLHQRYILAFQPNTRNDNKQHSLEVRLRNTEIQKPRIFWRHAYNEFKGFEVR